MKGHDISIYRNRIFYHYFPENVSFTIAVLDTGVDFFLTLYAVCDIIPVFKKLLLSSCNSGRTRVNGLSITISNLSFLRSPR